jgi:predicted ATPase/DNA-binding XRE family transcriptional regulator
VESLGPLGFGVLLRRYRLEAEITQQELAERANISVEAVSTLERGARRRPQRQTIDLLATALGLSSGQQGALLEAADATVPKPRLRIVGSAKSGAIESVPNNLPWQVTPLIGRDDVLTEVEPLVLEHALVSLVGTGGVGKTRVALQVGVDLLEGSGEGVWFVDLAPLSDSATVVSMIASTFALREQGERPLLDVLLQYLRPRRLLLILDNCEHLIEEVARVADAISRVAAEVRMLATSREPLRIAGEQVYRIRSLSVPPENMLPSVSAATAMNFDAVVLFTDRARAADRRFILNDENAPFVGTICRQLDGIALAIELAAARTNVLSVKELAESLDERFRVLTSGSRTAPPRQKTLRALIDWSYDLCSESERLLFRRLAVFVGAFSLDLAIAVCADAAIVEVEILNLLGSLVDKSLVQADFARDDTRYRLLESTREYSRDKLIQSRELDSMTRAHAASYLKLAENMEGIWEITPDTNWRAQADPELENWRAALRWAFGTNGDTYMGQRLAAAMYPTWFTRAPSEGRRWIRAGLDAIDSVTPTQVAAKLALSEAHLAMVAQQYEAALPQAERALHLFEKIDDRKGIALAKMFVGAARGLNGDVTDGDAFLQAALIEFRRLGSRRSIAATLTYLGALQSNSGNVAAARPFFVEALEFHKSVGAARPAAHLALNLAEAEFQDGNALQAVRLASEALVAERDLNDLDAVTFDLCNLAAYLVSLDRWGDARTHAREALSLSLERQITAATMWALQRLAAISALRPTETVAEATHNARRAARLIGFVDARIAELGIRRDFTERKEYERIRSALEDSLGVAAAAVMDEGRSSGETRIAEEALLI